MKRLVEKTCRACEGETLPLGKNEAAEYLSQVPGWTPPADYTAISREFLFDDFAGAMRFVNKVADLAEKEGHHPDIHIWYNRVTLELSTHAIKGLSENDFILAAKINLLA